LNELWTAFWLGNGAILTNACLLPLYPGLMAFLAGQSGNERAKAALGWLGLLVLAGVLTTMVLIGLVLFLLNQSFGSLLPVLLPIIYIAVFALGAVMLFGYNPFARMTTIQAPMLSNPYLTAYVYGLLFGPMTLPCTGPIITSVFILGVGNTGELVNGLLFFLAFGLGFGWPLVLLPFLARAAQKQFIGWMNVHHVLLTRASGVLLIGIALFGFWAEVLPNLNG
jgi:cytochrome c-type biogenesis protein